MAFRYLCTFPEKATLIPLKEKKQMPVLFVFGKKSKGQINSWIEIWWYYSTFRQWEDCCVRGWLLGSLDGQSCFPQPFPLTYYIQCKKSTVLCVTWLWSTCWLALGRDSVHSSQFPTNSLKEKQVENVPEVLRPTVAMWNETHSLKMAMLLLQREGAGLMRRDVVCHGNDRSGHKEQIRYLFIFNRRPLYNTFY